MITDGDTNNGDTMSEEDSMVNDGEMMNNEDSMTEEDKMMDDGAMTDEEKMETGQMEDPGVYKNYSTAEVAAQQAAGNKVVLFFHASWCPFCKTADEAFVSRPDEIPSKVGLLKIDYDSNIELRKKYGVTYQHTFVQIDANGEKVAIWSGGDIDALRANYK